MSSVVVTCSLEKWQVRVRVPLKQGLHELAPGHQGRPDGYRIDRVGDCDVGKAKKGGCAATQPGRITTRLLFTPISAATGRAVPLS
ncbi:hypothetical protein J6590_020582 [Homalodisca vitripennis]|nr:hypothetical protein J6590_020582 [Homalodisca vitripennis]